MEDNNSDNKKIYLHSGFQKTYMNLRGKLAPAVLAAAKSHPDYRIVFTGHSLGSALATIAAVDFHVANGFGDRIQVFAYASPRVGNPGWSKFVESLPFAKNSFRIVKFGDSVPHLPPVFLGYKHVFHQFTIGPDNAITRCDDNPTDPSTECQYNDFLKSDPTLHPHQKYLEYFGELFSCSSRIKISYLSYYEGILFLTNPFFTTSRITFKVRSIASLFIW
jgi:hypothetical protein